MSLTDFLHGVETVVVDSGPRPIQTVRSSVIGLIGTAPEANEVAFPLDFPVLVNRRQAAAMIGKTGTLPQAIDAIYDQGGALIVVIRVADGGHENEQLSKVIGGVDAETGAFTGVHVLRAAEAECGVAPMIFIAPGFTHQRPIGVSGHTVTSQGNGYTHAEVTFTGGGVGAVLPSATVILTNGKVTGLDFTSLGYGIVSPVTAQITGDGTGAAISIQTGASANPVVGELKQLADAMKAHIIADGPATTDSAAFAYRNDHGTRRVYIVDPKVSGWSVKTNTYALEPASPRVAGLIARVDNVSGFWESPSNKEVYGMGGISRPIDYAYGDKNSRANILNENQIATFIRDDGWYLWGNRTCSADEKFAFLSVSRTADMIDISIAKAHRWAVDRSITKNYLDDVTASVKAYMRQLKTKGAILGGDCWVDPEFNTEADITQGHVTFSYDFTPPYPAERVTFRSHLVSDYIRNLFA
ncbi:MULTISPECIES: phage tail sheath C-terminal domain-containing protein [unclassified Bradyrhizobium]|uniref:phage tail sheath C-terminal domain-containing protein n=1 Tax=unclassified Bradyrhizobium TaxID=2631580 RepID=UPI00291609EC|nr:MULTISPECIES: phage tail sheath C-terminal domain-containing protein [unclassified Bradyrhizobium]